VSAHLITTVFIFCLWLASVR